MHATKSINRLLLTGGALSAIVIAPALAGGMSSSVVHNAAPSCPEGQSYNPYLVGCAVNVQLGPGAFSQEALSQPGDGYNGPGIPAAVNAPSQRLLTICNGGGQSNCLVQALYGHKPVPTAVSRVGVAVPD